MEFIQKKNAQVFLVINAILWGSSYIWSKLMLGYLPGFAILAVCSAGSLTAVFMFFPSSIKRLTPASIAVCSAIGALAVLSNSFTIFALQKTSSSNAAFIIQSSVIITPLIMAIASRKLPGIRFCVIAVIAMTGIFMLAGDGLAFSFALGDLYALGAALFFSLRLAALNIFAKKIDAVQYTFIHHAFSTITFVSLAMVFDLDHINLNGLKSPVFIIAAGAAIFVAVVTELLQSRAVKFVKPEKANLIYTAEPLTTALLAFFLIGEKFTGASQITGCVMIFTSVLLSVIAVEPAPIRARALKIQAVKPQALTNSADPVQAAGFP